MAEPKVYIKKGNTNYKEKKLIKAIREKIVAQQAKDPNFAVDPVRTLDDLKSLHDRMVAEPVEFTEDKTAVDSAKTEQKNTDMSEDAQIEEAVVEEEKVGDSASSDRNFVDPFNREDVIVNDYVLGGDEYATDTPKENADEDQRFDEPTSEKEAFEMPEESDENDEGKKTDAASSEQKSEKKKVKEEKPVNPAFDQMSAKKKKRSTERFAKHIVNGVCGLLEKGFVWFANKDINEVKLAEYELSNEIDLTLLLELENGQEASVKKFFQIQCQKAEELSKISQDDRKDLTDSLAEYLLEQGIAPSPSQELLIVGASVVGGLALNLIALKSQTNSLLRQLKTMNEDVYKEGDYTAEAEQKVAEEQEQAQEQEQTSESAPAAQEQAYEQEDEIIDEQEQLLIGDEQETKE
jgi:hypothetical protein